MAKMSSEERERYLADLHVGVIAVERPDRAPLAVPVWYTYEPGGEVRVGTGEGSAKDRAIRAAGRFTITAQDEQPPYRYVTAEGDVAGVEPAAEADMRALAIRYLGEEAGTRFADEFAELGVTQVVIRMRPTRWLSTDYSKE
ncbi:pyridoxamine 5'-phosphate oxidase family protein [Mycobacterium sp. WMMD1722]|uniref:pyridoxamine 5'-phosphate oxidase family protein n=1 Tax=Mycobacterium sp. WMMD1722 TaxID=3404117 RepID=UPI003BF51D7E